MWIKERLPVRIWDNLITILGVLFIAVCVWFGVTVHSNSVKAERAADQAKAVARENAKLTRENARLARENRRRIAEIQRSRVLSCERTYQAFVDLFTPSIPPSSQQTPEERKRTQDFFRRVEQKKAECAKQVSAKPRP